MNLLIVDYRVWSTNYAENFEIMCDEPNFITNVQSTFSNFKYDRKWVFTCGSSSQIRLSSKRSRCRWNGFSGIYDQPFKLECLKNGFMQGIGSIYSNHHKDRMWDYYCCFNDDGYVLRGFNSSHHNIFE
ncbi:hypothetical protein CHS0354_020719 [Potamilus streckersoni]|uniref:Uncharacterized protein n=1 Tax=Potamilus streckersoni TaxID=2493646 RepID=A0AAE0S7T2_9BIVA|nr:hypothetical protein CHS0354_020719 [Potamilus streckersoni]